MHEHHREPAYHERALPGECAGDVRDAVERAAGLSQLVIDYRGPYADDAESAHWHLIERGSPDVRIEVTFWRSGNALWIMVPVRARTPRRVVKRYRRILGREISRAA